MTDDNIREHTRTSMHVALAALALTVVVVALGAIIYVRARQFDWTLGRIYMGLFAAHLFANVVWVLIWNPVVLERRMVFHRGTKAWDHVLMAVFVAVFVALVVVAVQDLKARDGDPSPPGIPWLIGLAFFVPGWTLITWAMVANEFFEKTVRIQTDHGHHVIDSGPYAYIRHPGYVGFGCLLLATPLMLASPWTLLPALAAVVLLVIRTALEDRTLQAELPGYCEYARRVRFRLLPGLW